MLLLCRVHPPPPPPGYPNLINRACGRAQVLPIDFGTPPEENLPLGAAAAVPPPATPPPPPPSAVPGVGGVFSVGEGVGMPHGSPRVAVDPAEVRESPSALTC